MDAAEEAVVDGRYYAYRASFSPSIPHGGLKAPLVLAPLKACSPIQVDVSDAIVLVQRGGCTFMEKAYHAQTAGARAMLVVNTADDVFTMASSQADESSHIRIPVYMIGAADGKELERRLNMQPAPWNPRGHESNATCSRFQRPYHATISRLSTDGPQLQTIITLKNHAKTLLPKMPVRSLWVPRSMKQTAMSPHVFLSGRVAIASIPLPAATLFGTVQADFSFVPGNLFWIEHINPK